MTHSRNSPEPAAAAGQDLAVRSASGAAWIAVEMAANQVVSLIVFAVMARFVTPSEFGLMNITYLGIYVIKALAIDNVVVAVSRKPNPSDAEYSTSFWLTIGFAVIIAIMMFLCANLVERLMGAADLAKVMRPMSLIIVFLGLSRAHEMRLMRAFDFRTLALRSVVGILVGGGIGIVLARFGYGVTALITQQIVASCFSLVLLWTYSRWTPSATISLTTVWEILRFMRVIAPTSVLWTVNQNSDTFLVAYCFGPSSAGVYAIAKRLRQALQSLVTGPFGSVLFSAFAEIQDDPIRFNRIFLEILTVMCVICAPLFFGASSIAAEAISLLLGDKWSSAAPMFRLLCLGALFSTLQGVIDTVFVLRNVQIWSLGLLALNTALAFVLFYPATRFGTDYIAAPFSLPPILSFLLAAALLSRLIRFRPQDWLRAVGPSLISAAAMYIIVATVRSSIALENPYANVLALVGIGGIAFVLTMCLLGRHNIASIMRLAQALRHKIAA